MSFLFTALMNGVAVWLGSKYLDGVKVEDFYRAIIVGLVVAFLNAALGSFLEFIPTPGRIASFGIFSLLTDALVLMLADYFLKGLTIKSFWWAVALAAVVSVVNIIAHWIF
ncbi:MAG: phage holin family protein [Saprospiraceae bacterium]|nr:phage holin family protein [Saprospiraceae bacterium]